MIAWISSVLETDTNSNQPLYFFWQR